MAVTGSRTSSELCRRALRAYERLYRLLDCDDPDLAANVTFTAGRVRLLRLSAAAPWEVTEPAARDLVELIERADRARDPAEVERLFATFVDEVCRRLERRGASAPRWPAEVGRRAADRVGRPAPNRDGRPAPGPDLGGVGGRAAPRDRQIVPLRS